MVTNGLSRVRRSADRALERLHRLAESGWGGTSCFLWGLGQSSVVPGPAEAVLVPLGIADPPAAWRLAAWTFAGTVIGAVIAFAIGMFAFDAVQPLLGLVGIGAAEMERLHALAGSHGTLLVLVSTMTPISTKVVSIAAGAFGLPIGAFVATLALARGVRLLVVAAILRFAGERVRAYLARGARDDGRPRPDAPEPVERAPVVRDDDRFAAERPAGAPADLERVVPERPAGVAADAERVADERVAAERFAAERPADDRFGAPAAARGEDGAGR